ncbi:sulfatase [Humisphaera borealis]|uniref:Sulfatase n=1 Tax=Humisphaera borealis TaxID=2807512 RepID=A0A7M2WZ59_9BACT|nr:sulfatase [Humisphaera borealis]QOV90807.1 sulfatase [Humisphaera borealis]
MPRTFFALVALACLIPLSTFAASAKPNVLFIMADDYRPELASYGSSAITPNLNRLAARSLQFDRAYCQQAVCNPSRSSMLTGLRPDTLGLWNNGTHFRELKPDVMTLPLWFKQHGYETRCSGKIFHNWHTKEKGDARSWSAPEFLFYANHGDDKPQVKGELPPDTAKAPKCECRDVPDDAYYDGRVAAEAIRVMSEVKDKPLFLAVGFWKPHAPFNAPKKYWDLYQRDKLPPLNAARPTGAPEIAFHDSREILGTGDKRVTLTPGDEAEMRHGYFANISYLDAQLGKVLDALDASGMGEKSIIVFAGDHGYHLGEHGLWAKTSNFEFDARVPLMISAPGMSSAGKKTESLTELVDLFPTLVELCGLPPVEGLEGTSLTPILKDPLAQLKAAAYTQHPRPAYYDREPEKRPKAMGVSVRTPSVRYTEWRDWTTGRTIARELYDAVTDPNELTNAIDSPRLASEQVQAEAALRRQWRPKSSVDQ